jgi:hypothetical protein
MADGVDTSMHQMQPADVRSSIDRVGREAQRTELIA